MIGDKCGDQGAELARKRRPAAHHSGSSAKPAGGGDGSTDVVSNRCPVGAMPPPQLPAAALINVAGEQTTPQR